MASKGTLGPPDPKGWGRGVIHDTLTFLEGSLGTTFVL